MPKKQPIIHIQSADVASVAAKVHAAARIRFDRADKIMAMADQISLDGDNDTADLLAHVAKREEQIGHKIIATWQRFAFMIED